MHSCCTYKRNFNFFDPGLIDSKLVLGRSGRVDRIVGGQDGRSLSLSFIRFNHLAYSYCLKANTIKFMSRSYLDIGSDPLFALVLEGL